MKPRAAKPQPITPRLRVTFTGEANRAGETAFLRTWVQAARRRKAERESASKDTGQAA